MSEINKKILIGSIGLLFLFKYHNIKAQIDISLPKERMVFQRSNLNQANVIITGSYYQEIDKVEARLIPKWGGSGIGVNWTTLQLNPDNGYYKGELQGTGGWYSLEVRASKNNIILTTKTVQRVGIGEVFVIAGQSNAQGGAGVSIPATDERVSTVDFTTVFSNLNKLPVGFSPLAGDSTKIGPFHYVPSAWGKLGDLLVNKWNVPVLFYGAAHGGTSSEQWSKSSQNLTFNGPSWMLQDFGAPYRALENSITIYASLTGLRAVLWHQGESDQYTSSQTYYENIVNVINKTREQTEFPNLAWVMARASINPNEHSNVLAGQNLLIQNYSNVFEGPNTDLIVGGNYRTDGIHFTTYAGQIEFANAWNSSLDESFINNSTPMPASPLLPLTFNCLNSAVNAPTKVELPLGYDKYYWSNSSNSLSQSIGYNYSGCCQYTCLPPSGYENANYSLIDSIRNVELPASRIMGIARKASKKTLFTPVLNITNLILATKPSIISSQNQVRVNENIVLTGTNCNGLYQWSNGMYGNPITFSGVSTNSYTSNCKTLHCLSTNSNVVSVSVSNCFTNSLNLTGTVSTQESAYKSNLKIESVQKINPSGKIQYSSSTSILLTSGFEASVGAVFETFTNGCEN